MCSARRISFSFDIRPGITGLLGPNGAVKTTLLRMMTGLAKTSSGAVTAFGEAVRANPPLYRGMGVMSEHETVCGFMKGREFFAASNLMLRSSHAPSVTDFEGTVLGGRRECVCRASAAMPSP